MCDKCATSNPRHTLPPELIDTLLDMRDDGTPIFTSSDGSYREQGNSSTYGVNIGALSPVLNYSLGGHLRIAATEASSLRMELEGLIAAYEVIPSDVTPSITWITRRLSPFTITCAVTGSPNQDTNA